MGLIGKIFATLFGDNRNVIARTAEVFRENAEAGAARQSAERGAALSQFEKEFAAARASGFDRFMDGVNRLPRPALALGTLGLFIAAMVDPVWFAARMQGIALVPEPLWWLLGVIVSFYFGARHQYKGQNFQRSIVQSAARAPQIAASIAALESAHASQTGTAQDDDLSALADREEANPALQAWRARTYRRDR
ncbi:carboxylesterase [Pelagivirga sediminicola]|uniref:Carboxylesterase n=1 Tax=Pelagivirga sediminicola TaxID=2170575 RepID=A0A2T7GBJ8_9RHOB|nr:holin family protein [Pelagivirga sediminicola]PVA11789.1 carboxylesterase [Pelagivirga sediminicola]